MTRLAPGPAAGPRPSPLRPRPPRPRLPGRPGQRSGWAALSVVWVVWGSTYLAIRVGDQTLPPFAMAAARYLAAGLVLFPVALASGRRPPRAAGTPRAACAPRLAQWAGMATVGTLLLAFGNGGVCYAERTLPSGLAALLVATVPLWMVLADWVINGRRPRLGGWLAVALGLAGVAVLAQPHGHGGVLAVLVVLGASMSWGTGSVLAGRLPAPTSPLLGSAMEMLAGGAVLAVLAAASGELTPAAAGHASAHSLLALAYLIGPGSLLALTCYVIALRRLPTAVVSTYAYVNPVVAVSLGTLILGEPLTGGTLLGGAIIVAAVVLLVTSQARHPGEESVCHGSHRGAEQIMAKQTGKHRSTQQSGKLSEYRGKRDLAASGEPGGGRRRSRRKPRFVVQEHQASSLHYDFRLEAGGTLKSWAIPKGPSADPAQKRLAMPTEDHPLEYEDFEGVIPAGEYGAGEVIVWDTGSYDNKSTDRDGHELSVDDAIGRGHVSFVLHGRKLRGGYSLTRMRRRGRQAWLLVKKADEYAGGDPVKTSPESVKSGKTVDQLGDS